jgi:hypothetical protein
VVHERIAVCADDGADDDQRHEGAKGPAHQEGSAANFIDKEECGEGGERVNDAVDPGSKEGRRVSG